MSDTQTITTTNQDQRKAQIQTYFGQGVARWQNIYGSEPVSFIRRTVREGHAAVVNQALAWAWESGTNLRVLDAGCGPGLVSRALARAGGTVVGCDIAPEMVAACQEAAKREPELVAERMSFVASDLETVGHLVNGPFDLAICLDVLIYYPEAEFGQIMTQLATLSPNRIIFTYAPGSPLLRTMHAVGRAFPKRERNTSLEIIGEAAVKRGLATAGLSLKRQRNFSKGFYHVVLAEAVKTPSATR